MPSGKSNRFPLARFIELPNRLTAVTVTKCTGKERPISGPARVPIIEPAEFLGFPVDGVILIARFAIEARFCRLERIVSCDDAVI